MCDSQFRHSFKIINLLVVATLLGSPFSFAGRCQDFLQKGWATAKQTPEKIADYVKDVRRTRGGRLILIDPPTEVAPATWRHPFRTVNDYLINKPVEAISEQILYKKKRPSFWLYAAIMATAYHFSIDVPLSQHTDAVVEAYSEQNAKVSRERLDNDLVYEGISKNLQAHIVTEKQALEGAYALNLTLNAYAHQVKALNLNLINPQLVNDFKGNILFSQSRQLTAQFQLNELEAAQVYYYQHLYYIDIVNLSALLEGQNLPDEVIGSLFHGGYRQALLKAFAEKKMEANAFRYLIEKDIELVYEFNTNLYLESIRGLHLNPKKTLVEIQQGLLIRLGLIDN